MLAPQSRVTLAEDERTCNVTARQACDLGPRRSYVTHSAGYRVLGNGIYAWDGATVRFVWTVGQRSFRQPHRGGEGGVPVVTRHRFHGQVPSISTSSEKLNTTRISTMTPNTVTLSTD